jgi:putative membrane protein
VLAALLSALHVLTLGVGLGAVFARGRALRAVAGGDRSAVGRVLAADNLWGIAAFSWIVTGFGRLFSGTDKALDFYVYNGFFWLKMGLFALVFVLEIGPMVTFIRWRIARGRGVAPDLSRAALFAQISHAEMALVVLIPFAAAAMARGLWLFA